MIKRFKAQIVRKKKSAKTSLALVVAITLLIAISIAGISLQGVYAQNATAVNNTGSTNTKNQTSSPTTTGSSNPPPTTITTQGNKTILTTGAKTTTVTTQGNKTTVTTGGNVAPSAPSTRTGNTTTGGNVAPSAPSTRTGNTTTTTKAAAANSTTNLKIGNANYPLNYQIKGGKISGISVEKDNATLLINISSTSNGTLTIELPRNVIDSKKQGNVDDNYAVFVDGQNTGFDEIKNNARARTLSIDFDNGSQQIEIAGTHIAPEFGGIAAIVLAIAIVGIIIAGTKYNNYKNNKFTGLPKI